MVQNPAFDFIIETSFFCTIFLIFSAIAQDKRLFFTTFDYIVAVIQALQFVVRINLPATFQFSPAT
jgi:hypothetical protein